ncbi:MAG: DUF1573 domain-containing protein [Planctomycetia bacterium]|nr:DUF1573 domain-containing protein [Planctomycetia bacterium]
MKKRVFLLATAIVVGFLLGFMTGTLRFQDWPQTFADPAAGEGVLPLESWGNGTDNVAQRPRVEVERVFDLGVISEDVQEISHDFVLRNAGEQPLQLSLGPTSCHCTGATISQTTVPPGESATIAVQLQLRNLKGTLEQSVLLYTNDPDFAEISLTLTGKREAPVWWQEPEWNVGRLLENQEKTTRIPLFSSEETPLEVTELAWEEETLEPFLEGTVESLAPEELRNVPEAKSGKVLVLTLKPGLPRGAFQQKLRLKTNSAKRPELSLMIHGVVGEPLTLHGQGWNEEKGILTLDSLHQGEKLERTLWLIVKGENYDRYPLEIKGVTPDFVQVKLGETSRMKETQTSRTPLTITIPADAPACNYWGDQPEEMGLLLLQTNEEEPMRIGLRFTIF